MKVKNQIREFPKTTIQCCHGFTLIELSIVLLITSILMIPLLQLYSNYITEQKVEKTKSIILETAHALSVTSPFRYPCPSDRSLPSTSPYYGMDVCTIPGFSLGSIPVCNTAGHEQGICKTPGARDTDTDADTTAGTNKEFVLIGGVPIKVGTTVIGGLGGTYPFDAWDNQLTYAVSYISADPLSSNGFIRYKYGLLRIVDEWGNDTAGTNLDAHFIVISHGPDGIGAYTHEHTGTDCNIGDVEGENCDGDNTFVQGLSHYGGEIKYDDYSYVQTENSSTLWQIVTDPNNGNAPSSHITAVPSGQVGLKMNSALTTIPNLDLRMDVNGNIRADTVRTQQLCDKTGNNCLDIDTTNDFFGTQKTAPLSASPPTSGIYNDCPDGQVIKNISQSRVTCSYADVQPPGHEYKCPAGKWVEQVFTDGTIQCTGTITCPGSSGCVKDGTIQ